MCLPSSNCIWYFVFIDFNNPHTRVLCFGSAPTEQSSWCNNLPTRYWNLSLLSVRIFIQGFYSPGVFIENQFISSSRPKDYFKQKEIPEIGYEMWTLVLSFFRPNRRTRHRCCTRMIETFFPTFPTFSDFPLNLKPLTLILNPKPYNLDPKP